MPIPTELKLLQKNRTLEIHFEDKIYILPCEYLRVFSPSAEVRGHGVGLPLEFPTHKENVNIISIEPIGQYAVKLVFDDGHQSGIYSWETLFELCTHFYEYWALYQSKTV